MKLQSNYMKLVNKMSKLKMIIMFQMFLIFYGIFFIVIGFVKYVSIMKLNPHSLYFMCSGTSLFIGGLIWRKITQKDKEYQTIKKEENEFYHRISQN